MSEIEAPIEQTQEDMHHAAHHSSEKWVGWVAVSSALIAALAAVTILMAGTYEHHSMEKLLEANDKWAQYQSKSLKQQLVRTRLAVYAASTRELAEKQHKEMEKDEKDLDRYDEEMKEIKVEGDKLTTEAKSYSTRHGTLAKGVTMFQVAIAVAAIAVLAKRPPLWYVGLGLGVAGTVFLILGVV
jgi:uncharacterized protein HemX